MSVSLTAYRRERWYRGNIRARVTQTVITPEKSNPVSPLHTAEYGSARFATVIEPRELE